MKVGIYPQCIYVCVPMARAADGTYRWHIDQAVCDVSTVGWCPSRQGPTTHEGRYYGIFCVNSTDGHISLDRLIEVPSFDEADLLWPVAWDAVRKAPMAQIQGKAIGWLRGYYQRMMPQESDQRLKAFDPDGSDGSA